MTLKEILTANGLTAEAADKVLADMKSNKIHTASEENLDVRYGKLKGDFDAQATRIKELEQGNAGIAELQAKVKELETKNATLTTTLESEKIANALKIELMNANALDIDYLTFKVNEQGGVKMGKDGKIEGIADTITALKTKFPTQFAADAKKNIQPNKLPETTGERDGEPQTLAEALKSVYEKTTN